jgi:signal transduction histidine kinase
VKIIKNISLRMRITLLAGAILILCSVLLTVTAALNADTRFTQLSGAQLEPVYTYPNGLGLSQGTVSASSLITLPAATLTAAKKDFNMTSIYVLAAVSVLGTALVYVVAGRSLRPIRRLNDTALAISADNLQQRIQDDKRRDELGALSRSFNVMLDRLEKSFLRQKRFSASVAHELKTPLATMNAGIQVLRLDENPSIDDYEKILATTERNLGRLIAVVDDLMELCYEDEDFYVSDIDLKEMFEAVTGELRPVLNGKNIDVRAEFGPVTVTGNPELVYRACFNLVENAAKYNKDGGRIDIETREENGIIKIIVADTGGGIPEDELQNIFEPFYRVNKSRSRKTGGAGLGLSIVKTIVEKHGWSVSAGSAPGRGSTFTIACAGQ